MSDLRRVNLFSVPAEESSERPDGYRLAFARLGPSLGASRLGASVYDLPPGQSSFPYHYEYGCEEWLLVVAGRPTLRHPGGEDELEPGDLVGFPEGPEGAHKVTNRTEETVRIMILSTKGWPGVAVYPDSDKVGLFTEDGADDVMVRRESDVGYWDREH
ncbi:MAG TPA: cupin domain-containing protein [Gaiellaceae bacterium]|nr:cupin domain-containing protein [Gaiellaceae bacterium]